MSAWVKTPPREPGAYWIRWGPDDEPSVVEQTAKLPGYWLTPDDKNPDSSDSLIREGYEWWPERIEPPREKAPLPPPLLTYDSEDGWRCGRCNELLAETTFGDGAQLQRNHAPKCGNLGTHAAPRNITLPDCAWPVGTFDGPCRADPASSYPPVDDKTIETCREKGDSDPALSMAHACACAVCIACATGDPLEQSGIAYMHGTELCRASAIHRLVGGK